MRIGALLETDNPAGSTIESTEPIARAVVRVARPHLKALVVVEGSRLVGILTRGDILQRALTADRSPDTAPVAEIMTTNVITVQADLELEEALELMAEHDVHHLPVLRGDEYIGLVGLADLTGWLAIELEARLGGPLFFTRDD